MRIELSVPLDISDVYSALKIVPKFHTHKKITHITTNSGEVISGDIFFALEGANTSGEKFADFAREKGALVVSKLNQNADFYVKDTVSALLSLAEYYKKKLPKLKYTIAITGSVGKTTTKEFLSAILSQSYMVHSTWKNYNNHIGVPLTIFSAPTETEILIVECGMNKRGEIRQLSAAVKPDFAIITNIGTAHIGNFDSREEIAEEKREITYGMKNGYVFVPKEEILLDSLERKITVSTTDIPAHYNVVSRFEKAGYTIFINSEKQEINDVRFNNYGSHLITPLSLSMALAIHLGIDEEIIKSAVASIGEDRLRHKFINLGHYTILDDSYNASYESVIAAANMTVKISASSHSALIGDLLELGDLSSRIHFDIGRNLGKMPFRLLFFFGNHAIDMAEGAISAGFLPSQIHINEDCDNPSKTALQIKERAIDGEIILFKASRGIRLERIIKKLK